MSQMTLPKNFGAMSALFGPADTKDNDELGAGVGSSFAIVGIRGKVWSIKHDGKETPLMRPDGDGPRGSIEVVIVRSSAAKSKLFYKGGFVDGSNTPPDCWSSNGVTPDAAVQNKQAKTCDTCPMNVFGSKITEAGKQAKSCSDHRRLAIVPLQDINNEMLGGPMLLRCPAASLKELKAFGDTLSGYGHKYFSVATRISFDAKEAYPKLVFSAIRPLDDAEGRDVLALRDDKRTMALLNDAVDTQVQAENVAPAKSPFEQAPMEEAPKAAAPKAAPPKAAPPKAAPKPAPAPEPEDEDEADEEVEVAPAKAAPKSFDALLDNIL